VNKFKQMVFVLEDEMESWEASRGQHTDYNPLTPYFSLAGGIVCVLLSVLWAVHMIVYMLVQPHASLFLNAYFIQVYMPSHKCVCHSLSLICLLTHTYAP
jgi:hypothetical protein